MPPKAEIPCAVADFRTLTWNWHPRSSPDFPLAASRPGESHPRALPEPCVNLSIHTAPDVQPLKCINGFASALELLPLPVGSKPGLNNAAPSVQPHYRAFIPTTSRSAPVLRIGTLILADSAAWIPSLASERQVLTFHTRAWSSFAPPACRMPLGQPSGNPRTDPGRRPSCLVL